MAIPMKERMAVALADFGWPEERKYPCRTQEELDAAAHLIGRAPAAQQPRIKARLMRIAARRGLALPATWKEGQG
jgi:hypothetical protein